MSGSSSPSSSYLDLVDWRFCFGFALDFGLRFGAADLAGPFTFGFELFVDDFALGTPPRDP